MVKRLMQKISSLRFAQKIGLLPVAAGAGFVVILLLSTLVGVRSSGRLELIRTGYAPSLELSRNLEQALTDLQRTMQDAVAAHDPAMLEDAQTLKDRFDALLDSARSNPVLKQSQLDQLRQQYGEYYTLARSTAGRMLQGETGGGITAALGEMTSKYTAVKDRLAAQTDSDRQAMADGFAAARTAQRVATVAIITVVVLSLGVLVALSMVIIRRVNASLTEFSAGFARISDGDFGRPLPVDSADEFGALSAQANGMMERLADLLGAVQRAAKNLGRVSDDLSAAARQMQSGAEHQSSSSEQTSSAMVEMAAQIEEVARAAHDLAAAVDETSGGMQELGASSDQVAKNSESLVASVEETAATIQQMAASIESVASKVRVVDEVSRSAAETVRQRGDALGKVIHGIDQSSRDIGKIVAIIEEIADQTNLLALNAAIEAARAGDVGRGFAVVAEEVRRLAERSVDSVREIGRVIEAVQQDTDHAVELTRAVLDEIGQSVGRTSGLVTDVHSSTEEQARGVAQIVQTTTGMQTLTQQLAHAAREQSNGIRSILDAVENMTRMTQLVATATKEQKRGGDMVVKATEEITAVARQNLATSGQLAGTTETLVKEADSLVQVTSRFAA